MIKDLLSSKNYRAYKLRQSFANIVVRTIFYIFYFMLIVSLLYLASNRLNTIRDYGFNSLSYFLIGIGLVIFSIDIFVYLGTRTEDKFNLEKKTSQNMFEYFCEEDIEILDEAVRICKKNKINKLNLLVVMLALSKINMGKMFMVRSGFFLDQNTVQLILNQIKDTTVLSEDEIKSQNKKFLSECENIALKNRHKNIKFYDLVLALYKNLPIFAHILKETGILEIDVCTILSWTEKVFEEGKTIYYWQRDYYPAGIGRDWSSGHTPNLNMFSVDISQYLVDARLEYQSKTRQELIQAMEDVLSKSGRNNILLIGDPGVGKTTLINSLAQKIARGKTHPALNYKHVVQLDINRILAGVSSKSELEARFLAIFNEASYAGNIILFVKNLDQLAGSYLGEMGTVNAAEFLLPYLESGKIHVIASITFDNFKNKLQANTSLESLFSKIEVKEMKQEEVLPSIEHLISYIEIKHKIVFTYQAVRELIELSARYIHDEPFPQKAVDLLSELGVKMEKVGKKIVEVDDVTEFISHRTKMPLGKVKEKEKGKLLNLEKVLHRRVIGQDEAINAIANALRRARAGLAGKKRPIGSFLFIGPTGVGKTETARTLAEAYYGSEKNMIRFDMSEFQEIHTIDRLIGAKSGNQFVPGRLTQGVKNNPYTLVLFDEIEKAHPNILNLLLQVLDEGRLTDASGRTIDFTSTIIICTSNAGSEKIREHLEDNISAESLGKVIINYLLKEGIFRPEFINRFDKVVCYKPLTPQEIVQIVKLMVDNLYKDLSEKNMKLEISEGALEKLAEKGFDPAFGARPLRRLIQEKVENLIAKRVISGEVKEGETIQITENDI